MELSFLAKTTAQNQLVKALIVHTLCVLKPFLAYHSKSLAMKLSSKLHCQPLSKLLNKTTMEL
jgi:hypothetical protein